MEEEKKRRKNKICLICFIEVGIYKIDVAVNE